MANPLTLLALAGSPRRGGNTDLLLEQAMEGARSAGALVDHIVLSRLNIHPCRHCDGCINTGVCTLNDDMQALHRQLIGSDRVILAAPLFFMGVTAQAKAAIDRCQALWVLKYLLKQRHTTDNLGGRRRALFLSVGGMSKPNLFEPALATVRAFFGTCDLAADPPLTFKGIDPKGAIRDHPTALHDAFEAGARLMRVEAAEKRPEAEDFTRIEYAGKIPGPEPERKLEG